MCVVISSLPIYYDLPIRTESKPSALLSLVMYLSMTESTQQFEVVPVKCDARIVYVVRCQLNLVVNYLAVSQYATP